MDKGKTVYRILKQRDWVKELEEKKKKAKKKASSDTYYRIGGSTTGGWHKVYYNWSYSGTTSAA